MFFQGTWPEAMRKFREVRRAMKKAGIEEYFIEVEDGVMGRSKPTRRHPRGLPQEQTRVTWGLK